MNRSRWLVAGISVTASLAVAWSLSWFVGQFASGHDTGRLAYQPAENMPPPVDLAKLQRGWPEGLDQEEARSRLVAYREDLERKTPEVAAAGATPAAAAPVDLGTLLASADSNAGKAKAQVCASCHDFTQGGPDRIGPNLWGVVGRTVASRPSFAYSPAMAAQHGAWTYERLFTYLASPARAVPGNKMGFAGLSRPEDRAAVVRFLATLGDNPLPLPQPQAAGAGKIVRK